MPKTAALPSDPPLPATPVAKTRFRLADYIKDGHLAAALRSELTELEGKQLELAQQAILEVSGSGISGTYDELLGEYLRAIRRALHPERKLVKNPRIDRQIVRNEQLAIQLDRELRDVTQDEINRANAAVKQLMDQIKAVTVVRGKAGEERFVDHAPSAICRKEGEHSTLAGACGYYKDPAAWPEVFRAIVREALAR